MKSKPSSKKYVRRSKKIPKFRSNFELKLATNLKNQGIPFDFESVTLKYFKEHKYKLDFSIQSGKLLVESKGYFTAADRQKMLDVKKENPELDIRLLFMKDQKIHKLSKTRYSDWCKKYGFKYAVSEDAILPVDWLKELKEEDAV